MDFLNERIELENTYKKIITECSKEYFKEDIPEKKRAIRKWYKNKKKKGYVIEFNMHDFNIILDKRKCSEASFIILLNNEVVYKRYITLKRESD